MATTENPGTGAYQEALSGTETIASTETGGAAAGGGTAAETETTTTTATASGNRQTGDYQTSATVATAATAQRDGGTDGTATATATTGTTTHIESGNTVSGDYTRTDVTAATADRQETAGADPTLTEHDARATADQVSGNSVTGGYSVTGTASTDTTTQVTGSAAVDSHQSTAFAYDRAGGGTTAADPYGHTATQAPDAAGRLSTATDAAGRRRDRTYDAAGRLLTETWYAADGVTVLDTLHYTYDLAGRVLTAGNTQGSYLYAYDATGRLARVQEPSGLTLAFAYDAAGDRTQVADSLGGEEDSAYDSAGRLVRRTLIDGGGATLRLDLAYDAAGRLTEVQRYADLAGTQFVGATAYTYDEAGRVSGIAHTGPDGGALATYGYAYDASGRLTSETNDGVTTDYGYDAAGQLTAAGAQTYAYDTAGNRTGAGNQVGVENELLSDGTWDYSYDAVGNLTGKVNVATGEAWTYGYGARNELILVEKRASAGGALEMRAEYKYDVYGNRIEKDVDPDGDGPAGVQVERYAYDGWDPAKGTPVGTENYDVWADLDASGSLTTRYLPGDAVDQLFARVGSGELPAWYLTDHLGSVRGVMDGAGVLLDRIAYDAFGNVTNETAPAAGGRYKWGGRELDVEAHLYNERARYYDPATARWLTQDPLGYDAGDSNLYRYVQNAPTNLRDPSGLDGQPALSTDQLLKALQRVQDDQQKLVKQLAWVEGQLKGVWSDLERGRKADSGFYASVPGTKTCTEFRRAATARVVALSA